MIFLLLSIVYILDRFYQLPLYVPLDTKPDSRRSATYLAKTIAKEAKCDDVWLVDVNYIEGNTAIKFYCIFDPKFSNLYFNMHVFLDDKTRDEYMKNRNKDYPPYAPYHNPCFKAGPAYMICESYTVNRMTDKPVFKGQRYYSQFPGEDITFTKNK